MPTNETDECIFREVEGEDDIVEDLKLEDLNVEEAKP